MSKLKFVRVTDLTPFKKLWKNNKALNQIEHTEIWKDILSDYRIKVHKPKSTITRKDLADRVFSEYIRLTECDENGDCECVTCHGLFPRDFIQNGHFVSRGVLKYRFHIDNCHPQCYRCNVVLNGNYPAYTLYMIDRYGRDKVEEMLNDKGTIYISQAQYEEMIKDWYKELKPIKRRLTKRDKDDYKKRLENVE